MEENKATFGRCIYCGKNAKLNTNGICQECIHKFQDGDPNGNIQAKNPNKNDVPIQSMDIKEEFKNKIVRGFRKFYKFFKIGSFITSIAMFVGWLLYIIFESSNQLTEQNSAVQSYADGATNAIKSVSVNYHWEILFTAVLILILGLFLSYIAAAIGMWVERMK